MKPLIFVFLPSYCFLFFFILSSSIAESAHPDVVHKTCARCAEASPNIDYNFCLTSLEAVPGTQTANLKELDVISLKLAISNSTSARSYVQKLLLTKPKDRWLENCLEDCLELYTDAIKRLDSSVKAIESGHYDDANIWISAAMDASSTCDGGFREKKGLMNPLKKENHNLFELGAISLAISTFL